MELKEFTEYLVKSIAKEPDMVSVQEFGGEEDSVILEIIVHESDMGAVIGRNGKMALRVPSVQCRIRLLPLVRPECDPGCDQRCGYQR